MPSAESELTEITYTMEERTLGCLRGAAVGDAIGKMTDGYWPNDITSPCGGPITGCFP